MNDAPYSPAAEPYARLRQTNLLLLGLMPAALLLARGGAEVIMAVIGLSFLWSTLAQRRWENFGIVSVVILIATYFILNLIVSPAAADVATSFSRSLLWLRFVMFFAAMVTWLLRSPSDIRLIVVMWGATLALAMADGYVQLATGISLTGQPIDGRRLTGPLDRPNIGMFIARIGAPLVAATILLTLGRTSRRYWYLASALVVLIAFAFIILSGERTATILTILAFLAAAVIAIMFMPGRRLHILGLVAVIPLCLLALYALSHSVQMRVENLQTDVSGFWTSPYGRIFHTAFRIWLENPLTGSGLKGFQDACFALGLSFPCHPHAHNIYLEWLSESGIIGLACFLAFVASLAWPVLQIIVHRPGKRLVGAALCGGLILTLFPVSATQSFFSNWPAMVMWTALGMIAATTRLALQPSSAEAGPAASRPVLVIKHSALGDMIMALPLFRAIRDHHPGQTLILLTTKPYAELARMTGCFDEIWTDSRPKLWHLRPMLALLRQLRSRRFQRIYDLQGNQRTRLYYSLLGSPRNIWVGNAMGCAYFIPDPVEPVHIAEHRKRQLALVGIPDPGLPDLSFLQADITAFGLPASYVLLVPGGAPHRPAKRWPAEAFGQLARHFADRDMTPVLIGQTAEAAAIETIQAACPQAVSLMNRTSIAELATLARGATMAVGNDTGPMHIIAAAGCPVLVLYSEESDPRRIAPRGDWVRLLQQPSLQNLRAADVIASLPPPRGA